MCGLSVAPVQPALNPRSSRATVAPEGTAALPAPSVFKPLQENRTPMSTTDGRLKHFIRHTEEMGFRCFEVSTLTEDGHRLSGFGATIKQAIEDAHEKATVYGDYDFPTYRAPTGGEAL